MTLEHPRLRSGVGLAEVIERVLDKGLVINADINISLVGVELLGIRIRAALASFETAAKYGLLFPSGTDLSSDAAEEARIPKESCPDCEKITPRSELLEIGCPWCGWKSPLIGKSSLALSPLPESRDFLEEI